MLTALERPEVSPDQRYWASVSFSGILGSDETLVGSPTVEEVGTNDLTISNVSVSTTALTINDKTVPIGKAVRFYFYGALAGRIYQFTATASTTSSPAQVLSGRLYVTSTC